MCLRYAFLFASSATSAPNRGEAARRIRPVSQTTPEERNGPALLPERCLRASYIEKTI